MMSKIKIWMAGILILGALALVLRLSDRAIAQTTGPEMLDLDLDVRPVVEGLITPTTMAFIGPDDFLVLEKNTGQVKRIQGGAVQSIVLDLSVNFNSERGLLGVALHPDFPGNPGVYLYWSESTSGADSGVRGETPLLGNRVDRFNWDGSNLTFDHNIILLRALQPANPPIENGEFGNHDGGVIAFGPDGKLYIFMGDNGRRGQMQNLPKGPFGDGSPDDQFGGPQPDNAHLTGVIVRLNDDGSTPSDNPFYAAGAAMGGEPGANIQKLFSYGHRNSFGLTFDPLTGNLWLQENSDDAFDEINMVTPGQNGGWIQAMGPIKRIAQFKEIETTFGPQTLQQTRYPPTNIADDPLVAMRRMYKIPGTSYSDPEFSWKWAIAPSAIGFVEGQGLGAKYEGDLFVGAARTFLEGGYLLDFNMSGNRRAFALGDPRLRDRVADNLAKFDITESEELLIGRNFGIVTDIETGPNGNLFLVSLDQGAVYEIFHR